jgi:tetratricopeptide (TPR) repeat protein
MRYSPILVTTTIIVLLTQATAVAKTPKQVKAIARTVTVEIKPQKNAKGVGSGVIIHRKGDLYTVVTNNHVVCGGKLGNAPTSGERYTIVTADGQKQQVNTQSVKLLGGNLDLAIIQFRSPRNYAIAKISNPLSLKADSTVHTAGFPATPPGFSFNSGQAVAIVNKRLTLDGGGYTVVYNALTSPGMSGSGVFNSMGELVAIHGQGSKFRAGTELNDNLAGNTNIYRAAQGQKIGYNLGIPVRWLIRQLRPLGISIGDPKVVAEASGREVNASTADEHFIAGLNKFISPGENVLSGKNEAIQEFTQAIQLSPRYSIAYYMRTRMYLQLKEIEKALADYNKAIEINPRYERAYINRAVLKIDSLGDTKGALADLNRAIDINPKDYLSYFNRGAVKRALNDLQGAMADYNTSIKLNPNSTVTYSNRGILKDRMNDLQGALADYNSAIRLSPEDATAYNGRGIIKRKLNDLPGAASDYNKAIARNPEFANAYFNRSMLKDVQKNRAGAIEDMRQCAKLARKQGRTDRLQAANQVLQQWGVNQ